MLGKGSLGMKCANVLIIFACGMSSLVAAIVPGVPWRYGISNLPYYSQFGQDKFVEQMFFAGKRGGIFVDIGALDGVRYSNTLFFEKQCGWSGLCIEPCSLFFEQLLKNRSCQCENVAVGSPEGVADFIFAKTEIFNGYSGLLGTYPPTRLDYLKKDCPDCTIIPVHVKELMNILREHKIFDIDYLSIDTEGGELGILRLINFDAVNINVVSVENQNAPLADMRDFMCNKGYAFVAHIVCDDIFVKQTYLNKSVDC